MGIKLKNPIIAGASRLTGHSGRIKMIEAAGASAIVLSSLFEEQIQLESFDLDEELTRYDDQYAEMVTIHPHSEHAGPEEHLMFVKQIVQSVSIPVFASLNAVNRDTWVEYSLLLEKTGIAGIELNFYSVPTDINKTGTAIENEQISIAEEIVKKLSIPVSIKLSPFYSNPCNVITRFDKVGVKGYVLFNRLFQPEIDVRTQKHVFPFNLSSIHDSRLPLRFAGLMYGHLTGDICSSTGIFEGNDVIKMILAGAACVQVVSTLFYFKISQITTMLHDIETWMDENAYKSLDDFRGKLSKKNSSDPWIYERAQYVKMLLQADMGLKQFPRP
jgi:dihydroorotate dehydrogenase (fumarate)